MCWGVFREHAHSPGRESDDTEILRLTAKELEALGFQVTLKSPEEVSGFAEPRPRAMFLMCEGATLLEQLQAWEASGVHQVNRPAAILNTYRERMLRLFEEGRVPFIRSRVVSTEQANAAGPLPVWVKRADVHNTQDGDVVFAKTGEELTAALASLAGRGIARALLQPHVDGDLIKFYGIGPAVPGQAPPWFRWFYHKGQRLAGHAFDVRALAQMVGTAAAALGLEVYGGDVIATGHDGVILLDLNAWPSFALYRDEAATAIARYLAPRFRSAR
jgi:hypothetical protein